MLLNFMAKILCLAKAALLRGQEWGQVHLLCVDEARRDQALSPNATGDHTGQANEHGITASQSEPDPVVGKLTLTPLFNK